MPVKGEELKKVTRLSFSAAFLGVFWFIVANPQQIWSIFLTEYLDATSSQLGLIVGLAQAAAVMHLMSVFIFSLVNGIKKIWLTFVIIARSITVVVAYAAFFVYRGGEQGKALVMVGAVTVISLALANTTAAGWFTWMSSLISPKQRASFFGRRSSVNQLSNVIFFFSITWVLDIFEEKALLVYTVLFFWAALMGVGDLLLHIGIPELESTKKRVPFKLNRLTAPLKNRTFLAFCFIMGFSVMGFNLANPFIAPFVVSEKGLGAPNIWIGLMVVTSQLTWVFTAGFWGKVMDRLGKKGVVIIGSVFPVGWLIYLAVTPQNYPYLLPLISFLTGLVTPAFFDGLLQITYSLADDENHTAYMAWYWAFFGMFGAVGPSLGGRLLDWADTYVLEHHLFHFGIHINITLSAFLALTGLFFYSRLQFKEVAAGRLIRVVLNPSIFRTMSSISVIEREKRTPARVENSLRKIKGPSGLLAEPEIINRLHDPDREIREEAAKTLGRIGSEQAVDSLISELIDRDSTIRNVSARALGRTGNRRAIPFLIGALADPSEELQEVCAEALGDMEEGDSVDNLLGMVRCGASEKVKVSGAVALSKKGRREAAGDIFILMKQSNNRVFRKQLAIALANMLGNPGEFYAFLQGDWDDSFLTFYDELEKLVSRMIKKSSPVLLKHLKKKLLPSIKETYKSKDYNGVVRELKQLVLEISYALYQKTEEETEEKNLRMLFWFLNQYEGVEASELDVLLSFYAIVSGQYLKYM